MSETFNDITMAHVGRKSHGDVTTFHTKYGYNILPRKEAVYTLTSPVHFPFKHLNYVKNNPIN